MTEDRIDLSPLFPLQAALDEEIARAHGVDYPSTKDRRVLALLVELGEFANETRCFKYWSNKGPSPKERILDEYADALHFLLSLGVALGVSHFSHRFAVDEKDLSAALLRTYEKAVGLYEHFDPDHYREALDCFLNLIPLFDYSVDEVIDAYKSKLQVNYNRQKEGY